MKRLISYLFATAVLAAALQPVVAHAQGSKWLLVIVILSGSGGVEQGGLKSYDSKKDCEDDRKELHGQLQGIDVWSKCMPLDKQAAPYKKERDT